MEMMLSKKQIWGIFLFEFKMCHKAVETTSNISNAFGLRTANEYTVQWWFKEFCKGDESLEDKKHSGWPSEVDNNQLRGSLNWQLINWRDHWSWSSYNKWEVAWERKVDHSMVIWHLKQIGKVKQLNKWVSHGLTINQKKSSFEVSSSLILCNNNKPFLDRIVTCDEKWILYDNQWQAAQWLDWGEAPKDFPKPNLHQIKVLVTVWWSAAGLIHDSFLNPGKTITAEKYA